MEKCSAIEEMIGNGSLEIDLVVESSREVEDHIEKCEYCSSLISGLRQVSLSIKNVERLKVSDSFDEKLRIRIEAVRVQNREQTAVKTIPFFARLAYYGAGAAAVIVGFFYLNSAGVFNSESGNIPQISTVVQMASSETNSESTKTIADSLEILRKTVSNDEELRMRVSTEE